MIRLYNLESIELELIPATIQDEKTITDHLLKEVELYISDLNKVITEGGVYIADLVEV